MLHAFPSTFVTCIIPTVRQGTSLLVYDRQFIFSPLPTKVYRVHLNPFRTAVPFWGQTTRNLTGLSTKRDCGSKRVNKLSSLHTTINTAHFLKFAVTLHSLLVYSEVTSALGFCKPSGVSDIYPYEFIRKRQSRHRISPTVTPCSAASTAIIRSAIYTR